MDDRHSGVLGLFVLKTRYTGHPATFSGMLVRGACSSLAENSPHSVPETEDAVSARWSSRAQERISSLRNEYSFLVRTADAVLVVQGTKEIRWFTFAGNILNLAIADSIRQHGYDDVWVSEFWICVKNTTDHQRLFEKIDGFNSEAIRAAFRVPEEY